MAIVFKPFETEYGYKSPGFTVDALGNVTVRTITNTFVPPVEPVAPDFNINEVAGDFSILSDGEAVVGTNPTISVERGATYNFVLNLNSITFNIFLPDETDPNIAGVLYSENLSHQNVITGNTLQTTTLSFSQTWQQEPNGYARTAQVLVPNTTGTNLATKKLPVVISLHDTGSNQATGITNVSWISNTILIAPQGYNNVWNVGYQSSKADDIALINSIIASLSNYDNVDTREITIIGYGNGAQLALQYANSTTNASVKNIITYNGLLNVDQYNAVDGKFYNYDLEDNYTDNSTVIDWVEVVPIVGKKVVMFNGKDDLNFLFNGGTINGQEFYSAIDSIYGMARADAAITSKITTGTIQPDGSELFSYNSNRINMYAYNGVANNFSSYQNAQRTIISNTIAISSYADVPVLTVTTGAEAQDKLTGTLTYIVPVDAPDTLYYGDNDGFPKGIISVQQPSIIGVGVFSSILNTGDLLSSGVNADINLSPTGTGLVTINPETTGFINNVNINVQNLTTSGTVSLTPNADVTISPQSNGVLTIRPTATGTINNIEIGGIIPRNGTFSNLISAQGTLNNTTIGLTTAAAARFSQATVSNEPTNADDVTKKQYVDNTATVLAIALGA